jgi:hypothetical protein
MLEKQCDEMVLLTPAATKTEFQPLKVEFKVGDRDGQQRCLRRHGLGNLRGMQAVGAAVFKADKSFKDYEPGFVYVDILCLSEMPNESYRRYLFVAIDKATQWVFLRVYSDQSDVRCVDFLKRLRKASPMKISTVLTNNGSQFTDRSTSKTRDPSGKHHFDVCCRALGIEHRLATPGDRQITRPAERFNWRIKEFLRRPGLTSGVKLQAALDVYCEIHNQLTPLPSLKTLTPNLALKSLSSKRPELFVRRVKKLPGLDGQAGCSRGQRPVLREEVSR